MNCLVMFMCVQFIHAALKRFVKYQVCFFRSFQYFIQQYCTRSWPHVYIAPNLKKIKKCVKSNKPWSIYLQISTSLQKLLKNTYRCLFIIAMKIKYSVRVS